MRVERNTVSVTVVTHNSEPFIARCLDSVLAQNWGPLEIIVVDNASQDRTASILADYKQHLQIIYNRENRGFSAAQNQAICKASGEWILTLNPDVVLDSNFVSHLVQAGNRNRDIGTVCGKLLSVSPNFETSPERRLDSAGIYFTPTFRHFDRGMNLPDGDEYNGAAFVFGATAAAALYRNRMIQDISVAGEFFDEDFFLYREDADVSWRAQLQGWQCLYLPEAVGYHVRRVFPGRRQEIPEEINRHCVKNRFLMRIKNATLRLYLRNFLPATARDIGILAYCLLAERKSLGAFSFVLRNWRRTLLKRRIIQQRRRVSDAYLQNWFRFWPVTAPVEASFFQELQTQEFPNPTSRSSLPLPAAGTQPRHLPQLES